VRVRARPVPVIVNAPGRSLAESVQEPGQQQDDALAATWSAPGITEVDGRIIVVY